LPHESASARHDITDISSAQQAASALRPLAGNAAGLLFLLGMVGVGFLAVPVMTTGAAYDMAQTFGWRHSLHARPRQARRFYITMTVLTLLGVAMNAARINPIRALVWAGIVQGFSTPPLLLLILLMTNNRRIMGEHVNGSVMNLLGWTTTAVIFAASGALVVTWCLR
jgi:Mn2+/Fe2+ NRAMP family transporter